ALTAADGSSSLIAGSLNSAAAVTFTLDFYSGDTCDASGNGEGQRYLGSGVATTDGSGNATFSAPVPVGAPVGDFVTATATDALGNTSEFSACVTAAAAGEGAPGGVAISGPATGFAGLAYNYRAAVTVGAATFPLTVTWHPSGQAPVSRPLESAADLQAVTWTGTGARTMAVTVHNGSGSVGSGMTFTIRATSDNVAPQAIDGSLACTVATIAAATLTAGDADGDALTYSIVGNGSKGTATITDAGSGAYTYVPNAGASGNDSFTFKVSDGVADSNVATVTVAIGEWVVYVPAAIHRYR
ncbi:MAG: Ig-like domain-containing protein, partial [Anaerolineae bacterium]